MATLPASVPALHILTDHPDFPALVETDPLDPAELSTREGM